VSSPERVIQGVIVGLEFCGICPGEGQQKGQAAIRWPVRFCCLCVPPMLVLGIQTIRWRARAPKPLLWQPPPQEPQSPCPGNRPRPSVGTELTRPAYKPSLPGQCHRRWPALISCEIGRSGAAPGWVPMYLVATNPGRFGHSRSLYHAKFGPVRVDNPNCHSYKEVV
jgi:hypothetical protein